jgi:hypothetical protein
MFCRFRITNGLVASNFSHLHITGGSVSPSNHKVAARSIVPSYVEVTTSIAVEVHLGIVVGPVLDCIDTVLAGFESTLFKGRSACEAGNSCEDSAGKSEGKHVGREMQRSESCRAGSVLSC